MRALLVTEPGRIEIAEVPQPISGDYDCLVRVQACAFCNGTDSKLIEGTFPGSRTYPFILGHESVGEVIEVGPRVKKFKLGDVVLRPTACYPPQVPGRLECAWGGFAEYAIVTDGEAQAEAGAGPPLSPFHGLQQLLPAQADPVEATILVPLKEAVSWLRKMRLRAGERVLVLGSGPVGLAFAQCAKIMGAALVVMSGRRDERLALAAQFGVDAAVNVSREGLREAVLRATQGQGVDLAIEAVGSHELLQEGAACLARGGRIGTYGVPPTTPAEKPQLTLDLQHTLGEWSLCFTNPDEASAHEEVLSLVQSGRLQPQQYVTCVLPLEQAPQGFELIKRRQALKVVVRME